MRRWPFFSVVWLLCWPSASLARKSFVVNSTDSIHHLRCEGNLHLQINAVRYRFHQYNCTSLYAAPNDTPSEFFTRCANQSSCRVDLKRHLYFRTRHRPVACRRIKLKDVLFNYSCINETRESSPILSSSLHRHSLVIYGLIVSLCLLVTLAFFALFCSNLQYLPRLEASLPLSDTADRLSEHRRMPSNRTSLCQSQRDDDVDDDFELKRLTIVRSSSSSSSFTSLNSKTVLTNPSEYDNVIKLAAPRERSIALT